jgi:hypothetical protein
MLASPSSRRRSRLSERLSITQILGTSAASPTLQLLTDHSGDLQIFLPFLNLPSRSLKDYYALIKDPMSLTAVQKKVRGVIGREAPTGQTLLKSWDAFEQAMSLVWKNARIYNEDGSDLYNLSIELEV